MLVSSLCAPRPRDATRRMSPTELVRRSSVAVATPSQQHLRRPSQQYIVHLDLVHHYIYTTYCISSLALNWNRSSGRLIVVSRCCWRGGASRRDASCAQHQLRRSSISSVAAVSAPSQQHQHSALSTSAGVQATVVSRDDERSTGAVLLKLFEDDDVHANCHSSLLVKQFYKWKSCWVSLTLWVKKSFIKLMYVPVNELFLIFLDPQNFQTLVSSH